MADNIIILTPDKNLEFVGRWYDIANKDHFWMQWRYLVFQQQCFDLKVLLEKKMKGLEIGCGHGMFMRQLEANTSWEVDGADMDKSALKYSNNQRGNLYVYDILDKNAQMKGCYDFIILFDVLEHIEKTQPFIEAALFHLKKGGYFFINVPACPALFGPYDRAAGHCRRYTKKKLIDEFLSFEVDVLDIRYWGLSMLPMLYLRNFFTSDKKKPQETIERGFRPPGQFVHGALKMIMSLETRCLHRPFLGTSIMAVIAKE